MAEFIGREDYLKVLNDSFDDLRVKSCALIGRRRIGKTAMIKEFIKDKRAVYIQFLKSDIRNNLNHMSDVMSQFTGSERRYQTLTEFFRDLSSEAQKEKTVIAFDEYPYISGEDGCISSMVQDIIDNGLGESMLILCGSSVKMMELELSSYDRPLFGRLRKIYVREMSFSECRAFHPNMSDEDQLRVYLTVGGLPYYHFGLDAADYREYISKFFLNDHAYFASDGEDVLNMEISPKWEFYSILDTISDNGSDYNTLITKSGIQRSICDSRMSVLKELGIITECVPMADAPKKPLRFMIDDDLVAFHFSVMRTRTNIPEEEDERFDVVSQRISTFHGRRFEKFCSSVISSRYPVGKIGRWWGKIPITDDDGNIGSKECDMDIVAEITQGNNDILLFAECKFRNTPADLSDLREMDEIISNIHGKRNYRKMIISRSGFTKDLMDVQDRRLMLVDMDMLLGIKDMPDL